MCLGTIRELQPRNIDSVFDKNDYDWVDPPISVEVTKTKTNLIEIHLE